MCRSVVITLAVAVASLAAQKPEPRVPGALVTAAGYSAIDFGMLLASVSVSAGMEVPEAENTPRGDRALATGDQRLVPVGEVAKAFERHHPTYRASVAGGVLVIRPKRDALAFLDGPSTIAQPVSVTGVMVAARRVFSALEPDLLRTGARLNSIGYAGADLPIVLNGQGLRVFQTLNQIAVQAPGHVWLVTTRPAQGTVELVTFGFLEADRRRTTSVRR